MGKVSTFMRDSSEKDGKAEIIMDYVLSWCLRQTTEECKNKHLLFSYCRYMLGKFIDMEIDDNTIVKDVKVWKEENYIDLWVEATIERNGKNEYFAILVENKYYTGIHDSTDIDGIKRNQLEVYRKKFDGYYLHAGSGIQRHKKYVLATCFEDENEANHMYDCAKEFGYKVLYFYDMLPNGGDIEDSESDIFNEFWLRSW